MESKVAFYVIRHGQTMLNLLDRVQGWVDSPLTQQGMESAKLLGKSISNMDFVAIYSSNSGRAIETAEIISKELKQNHVKILKDKRLMEWGFGCLEGENNKYFRDVVKNGLDSHICKNDLSFYLPEICEAIVNVDTISYAEDFQTIENRLREVLKEIAEYIAKNEGGNVLIVTHAFIIKTLVYLFAKERCREVNNVNNGSITKIVYEDEGFYIESINDTRYLYKND